MSVDAARDSVIVSAKRTAVGKAKRGRLSTTRLDELTAIVLEDIIVSNPLVDPAQIDDVPHRMRYTGG